MISRPTVLVLGAGASVPYGFPSGRQLRDDICAHLDDSNKSLSNFLKEAGFKEEEIIKFRGAFCRSGRLSVDLFLEHRQEFIPIGKAAIAAELIKYESEPKLFRGEDNWYEYLFSALGPSLSDIGNSGLSIITFNYDRSLDHFLYTSIKESFNLDRDTTLKYLRQVPIIHVHGQLGDLSHDGDPPHEPGTRYDRPYSAALSPDVALRSSEAIKIVHEGARSDVEFGFAKQRVQDAEVIGFLGFGYLPTNLDRLGVAYRRRTALVWGSACGIGEGDRDPILRWFRTDPDKHPITLGDDDEEVLEFLREHPVLVS